MRSWVLAAAAAVAGFGLCVGAYGQVVEEKVYNPLPRNDPPVTGPAAAFAGEPLVLVPGNFSEVVKGYDAVLVEFYAPWCGVCRQVKPELEEAARQVLGSEALAGRVAIATMDAKEYQWFTDDLEVTYYPTFKVYTRPDLDLGDQPAPEMAQGPAEGTREEKMPILHTAGAYLSVLRHALALPPVSAAKILPPSGLEALPWVFWRGTDGGRLIPAVVLFDPAPAVPGAALLRASFEEQATNRAADPYIRFALSEGPALAQELGLPADEPSLVVYRDGTVGRVAFNFSAALADIKEETGASLADGDESGSCAVGPDGQPTCHKPATGLVMDHLVDDFIRSATTPYVELATHFLMRPLRAHGQTLCFVFVPQAAVDDPRSRAALLSNLTAVADDLVASGVFAEGDASIFLVDGQKYVEWAKDLGLPANQLPAVAVDKQRAGEAHFSLLSTSIPRESHDERMLRLVEQNSKDADKPPPKPDANGLNPPIPMDDEAAETLPFDEIRSFLAAALSSARKADIDGRTPDSSTSYDVNPSPDEP